MRANATSEENQRRIERDCRKEERGGGREVVENRGRGRAGERGSGRTERTEKVRERERENGRKRGRERGMRVEK